MLRWPATPVKSITTSSGERSQERGKGEGKGGKGRTRESKERRETRQIGGGEKKRGGEAKAIARMSVYVVRGSRLLDWPTPVLGTECSTAAGKVSSGNSNIRWFPTRGCTGSGR
jgi:hypothetical protein